MENEVLESYEIKYWRDELTKVKESQSLLYDYYNAADYERGEEYISIDKELGTELRKICKNNEFLIYSFLVAALKINLSRCIMKKNICIGIPCYNTKYKRKIMLSKVLPLISHVSCEQTYKEYMVSIKEKISEIYRNQEYLTPKAVLENKSCTNIMELTPITICMRHFHDEKIINYISSSSKNEISFLLELMNDNSIKVRITYNSRKFSNYTINRLGEIFINVLNEVLYDYNKKIKEIKILSEKEKNQVLYEFNDTKVNYPKSKTIQELFEVQVEKTPDNIAVLFEEEKLTYKELNEKANSLARVLRNNGVKADSIVGIMVERSLDMIVGIIGILKAGGAYLPLDPKLPKERINYMIADSGINVLVTLKELTNSIEFDGEILDIKDDNLFKASRENLEIINKCSDLAYIIYTSGTTGNPKGVMIGHNNVVRLMFNEKMPFEFSDKDVWTMFHSYCFDFSVWEMYGALLYGGKLVMVPALITKDFEEYLALLKREKVTVLNQTPTAFYNLMNIELDKKGKDLNLRYIVFGGEALNPQMLKEWKQRYNETKIINMYGITETTVHVTYKEIGTEEIEKGISNIGKPIPTLTTYVMNENLNIQPIGVPGELCVGGEGVARGYLNRDELTERKFVMNPYIQNEKIYRSGDLVRLLENGDLEYLGRIDNQVKIRGFRIELGEIENRLLQHESVKEAAVLVKENKDREKYICAYVVSDKKLQELYLKGYLKEILPEYMIPAYFVELEKMPLTTNGKLDRRALPEPGLDGNLNEYEAPRNEIEEFLAKIWSEILGVEKVGINDNFFDIGGHSLKATMLMSKIYKELNKEVPLKELFKSPTIKDLSKYIESAEENIYSKIEKVEEKEYYEASSAQKRMYMLQKFNKDSMAYNMPVVFQLEGTVNKEKIEETFKKLAIRHDALRTYFETYNDKIIQKIHKEHRFDLIERKDNEEIEIIVNKFIRPFELEKAPLFRVELVENKKKTYLLIDMHHIISDGISMNILVREFVSLYNGEILEPLKFQYKDFAAWQNKFLKSEDMKKQEEYWVNIFSDEIPVLNMPTDYERPAIQCFEGNSVNIKVNERLTESLRKLARETETTMHMVLLSAFNILLSKYSGQEDIIIGTPIAGRLHADLQNIMGMFVNTLALRNKPKGDKQYLDFLKEVKENTLKAYENQSYQFETLVEKINSRRDASRNPLFDVMFNMAIIKEYYDIDLDGLVLREYDDGNIISKFDLALNAVEEEKILSFSIKYCSKLFNKETIDRLSNHYVQILDTIVNNIEIKLCEIELLTEKEKNQLLYDFNNTKVQYPRDKTIQELFEAQVEKTPDNIAVLFEEEKLTYKELNEKANSLARVLRNNGVKADSIVGIMVERSLEMIVGIMGILKAGGAFLPIDPSYPKERVEYMLKDSESEILLSKDTLVETLEFDGQFIDLFKEDLYNEDLSNLDKVNNSTNLVYVIYTSGTTGKAKGVMIENHSLTNYCLSIIRKVSLASSDETVLLSSYAFDLGYTTVFTALVIGAKLNILSDEKYKNPEKLIEFFKTNVTYIKITPSLFGIISNFQDNILKLCNSNLRLIILGGEPINIKDVGKFVNMNKYTNISMMNHYGPTESTIGCISTLVNLHKLDQFKNIIGKPLNNIRIYILDKYNRLQPIGVTGELCISGDGLARGYLNRPELTDEKFVDNPFEDGTRMYRTGDLARWLPDGNVELLGRIDHQVKIRGFRIETEEIEAALTKVEGIKKAVVIDREKDGEKYLCAYYIGYTEHKVSELRKIIKKSLPEYMIPSYFIKIENIPLTPNGKLDRGSLPEPTAKVNSEVEYKAPSNEVEKFLVEELSKIMLLDKIGVDDNLFEIGANSLNIMNFAQKIKYKYEIDYNFIFEYPYISEIAQKVKKKDNDIKTTIEKVKLNNQQNFNNFYEEDHLYVEKYYNEYVNKIESDYSQANLSQIKVYNNILLTGVTGYLGIYLLFELLKTTKSKLTLIIRGRNLDECKNRLYKKFEFYFGKDRYIQYEDRIYILNGDLTEEMFGLDEGEYAKLKHNIDCIINSAADVRHFGPYEQFYKANVITTQNILKFSYECSKMEYFHISTISVGSGQVKDKRVQFFTEYDGFVGQKSNNNYVDTKIEAERLVLNARSENIKTTIFRVGNITFNSKTGQCQENVDDNAFYQRIKSLIKLKTIPNLESKDIDISFVDAISKAIILLFNRTLLENQIFHISNPNKISFKEFGELSRDSKLKNKLQLLSINDFYNCLIKNYDDDSLKEYIDTLIFHTGILNEEKQTDFKVYSYKTQYILKKIGFVWENITEEHITNMLNYAQNIGFWDK